MYTSITWDLIVKSMKNRWKSIKPHTFLNYKDFNKALLLCLNSAYCNFDNNIVSGRYKLCRYKKVG